MTYRVEFRRGGDRIAEVEGLQDRPAAKRLAETELVERDAEIAMSLTRPAAAPKSL